MKMILLAIWITVIVLTTTNRVAENDIIECNGLYFLGRIINTLIWCSFLMW